MMASQNGFYLFYNSLIYFSYLTLTANFVIFFVLSRTAFEIGFNVSITGLC